MDPTIVSTGTGGIAIAYDYSVYLERIATALETLVESVKPTPVQRILGSGILEPIYTITQSISTTTEVVNISVTSPEIHNGVTATLTATIVNDTLSNYISEVSIVDPGSGYINPPTYTINEGGVPIYTGTTVLKFTPNLFTAIGNITSNIEDLKILSTGTGIRTYGAYDWIKPLEMISWYGQGLGPLSISTASISQLVSVISSLTNNVSKFE